MTLLLISWCDVSEFYTKILNIQHGTNLVDSATETFRLPARDISKTSGICIFRIFKTGKENLVKPKSK